MHWQHTFMNIRGDRDRIKLNTHFVAYSYHKIRQIWSGVVPLISYLFRKF